MSRRRGTPNVSLIAVSHSADVARSASEMARHMARGDVTIEWCGGGPDGSLGTDLDAIKQCIERAWNESGVAVLVDLGGAEVKAEMAIEALPEDRRAKIVLCDAPIVEGLVIAATRAAQGASLDEVRSAAEQYLR